MAIPARPSLYGNKIQKTKYPVGPYVVDFICLDKKLIIELDGGQHAEQLDYDNKRTRYLEHFGFRVERFWNNEVLTQFEVVLEKIRLCLDL